VSPTDRFEAANEILADALGLPPADRAAFARKRCEGNANLGASVLKLLSQFDKLGTFLERPVSEQHCSGLTPGEILIGRFRVVERLGQGGMGEVYLADDQKLGDIVALKIVRSLLGAGEQVMSRFHSEIRLARRVAHPNVCRIFDLFTDVREDGGELVFFTMEYLDGETLAERLRATGEMPRNEILRIAGSVAAGLDEVHRHGIVHRDMKPGNVILARDPRGEERVVVTDFGLAKSLDSRPDDATTLSGAIAGSPAYMAPEQFTGCPVTAAADVYALALIVFEMAAGHRAFPEESVLRAAIRRITEDAPALRSAAPSVPVLWDRAVRHALARDPSRRHHSAGEFIHEMEGADSPLRLRFSAPAISRRSLLYGGLAGTAVAASFTIWRYQGRRPLIGSGDPGPIVMLTPIAEPANPQPGDPPVALLSFLIEKQLGQSGRVRLLARNRVASAWKRIQGREDIPMPQLIPAPMARHIALREGAGVVLFGGVMQVGDSRVLGLKLELMSDRPEQARDVRERSFSLREALAAAFEAAKWIREMLGELNVDSRSRTPEELTTRNWHALEEYVQGNGAYEAGNRQSAVNHLREALRTDSDFALAAARLGDVLTSLGRPDEGLQYYEQAEGVLIEKHLTDRESLQIRGIFAFDTGRYDEAEQVFALLAENYPQDALPLFHRASALDRLGRPEEAMHLLDAAVDRDPKSYIFVFRRAHLLLDIGRIDEAERDCNRAATLSASGWTDQLRSALSFSRLDFEPGWSHLQRMASMGSAEFQSKAFAFEACFLAEQGRLEEAVRVLDRGVQFDKVEGIMGETQFAKQRQIAWLLIQMGRTADAIDRCREILEAAPGVEASLQTGIVLARAGRLREAEACLPAEEPKWPVHRHWLMRLRGEIALARGEARRALELMQQAPESRNSGDWPAYLVRAAGAVGDELTVGRHLTSLFSNPGRFWYEANVSDPGFFRWALGIAANRHFTPNQPQAATSLRALAGFFLRR